MKTNAKSELTTNQIGDHYAQRVRWAYIRKRRFYEQVFGSKKTNYMPDPRWDGGRDGQGARRSNTWINAAKAMQGRGIDFPEEYVDWHFRTESFGKLILPNQLCTRQRLDSFVHSPQREKQQANLVRIELNSSFSIFEGAVSSYLEWFRGDSGEITDPDLGGAIMHGLNCNGLEAFQGDYGGEITDHDLFSAIMHGLDCESNGFTALFSVLMARRLNVPTIANNQNLLENAACLYMNHQRYYDIIWSELLPSEVRRQLEHIYFDVCKAMFGTVATGNDRG